jgi:hypothetical protein
MLMLRMCAVLSCRPLTKYAGEEDGSKFLCQVDKPGQLRKDCVIYSLGSNVSVSSAALCWCSQKCACSNVVGW